MANTAYLNRLVRMPNVYWSNRGFQDGFDRRPAKTNFARETDRATYNAGYIQGKRSMDLLDKDLANGDLITVA